MTNHAFNDLQPHEQAGFLAWLIEYEDLEPLIAQWQRENAVMQRETETAAFRFSERSER
jgi:hypothetical protein